MFPYRTILHCCSDILHYFTKENWGVISTKLLPFAAVCFAVVYQWNYTECLPNIAYGRVGFSRFNRFSSFTILQGKLQNRKQRKWHIFLVLWISWTLFLFEMYSICIDFLGIDMRTEFYCSKENVCAWFYIILCWRISF